MLSIIGSQRSKPWRNDLCDDIRQCIIATGQFHKVALTKYDVDSIEYACKIQFQMMPSNDVVSKMKFIKRQVLDMPYRSFGTRSRLLGVNPRLAAGMYAENLANRNIKF
jgi:hypothetical protein